MSELKISLGERSYSIGFSDDPSASVRTHVEANRREGRKVAVITDRNVAVHLGALIESMFGEAPTLVMEPGEQTKSLQGFGQVLDFLAEHRIDRSGVLYVVGGGVIGDLGGFAAASYLRGIDFVQVPTSLLAMVDSAVGGKTGINISAGKNLVGAFHQPRAVFIGRSVLRTLPPREFAAGIAEVIKYALLGDAELFARLERDVLTAGSEALPSVVSRCCALKARVVESDERELAKEGGRALLNLGHTFGHAIEKVAGFGEYLHGEAVAIGLCAAARLSAKLGMLPAGDVARVDAVVTAHQLPSRLRRPLDRGQLFAAMARDKKVRAGVLRFVVLRKIGEAATLEGVPLELAEASFSDVGASP